MKKILALVLALVMCFAMVACGGNDEPEVTTPAATEPGAVTPTDPATPAGPSSLSVCLASEPDTLDPALNSAVDGATMVSHLFSGLAKWAQDESGKLVGFDTELAEAVSVTA